MTYTITEAAKRSGLTAHTLRFYDKQGLLPFGNGKVNVCFLKKVYDPRRS